VSLPYSELAPYYDRLNGGVDYDAWADFIASVLSGNGVSPRSVVLDAGCGTGQITVRLAEKGYDLIGVDRSPEMLSVARAFADERGVSPLLVCQDLSGIDLYGTVSAAVSTLDTLNYLVDRSDLAAFFDSMKLYIESGGLLIFDLNTKRKFVEFYGDNDYVIDEGSVFCGWQNHFTPSTGLATFALTIFSEQPDGSYQRVDEIQKERYYPDRTVIKMLTERSFELLAVYADADFTPAGNDDLRHFFVFRKV